MKHPVRPLLRIAALLIVCWQTGLAQTPEAPHIDKIVIKHIGPPAVSDDLIRANIRVKAGDPYARIAVDDDVRNLYATGYFYNVSVSEEITATQTEGSGIGDPKTLTLTYVVQGKPVLTEVRFTGNKRYSVGKLRRKVTSKPGEPLDERKLFNDSQEILKLYQRAGLQKTKVEYKPSINESLGKGSVTFEITEAPKVRIDEVYFDNAKAFSRRKLHYVIKTRRWWMFSWLTGSGKLKDEQFEEDKDKLHEFYAERGYIDFELKDVRFETPRTNHMIIHLDLFEGARYKVGSVEFKGNSLYTKEEIVANLVTKDGEKSRRGLQLRPGEVFTPKKLETDTEAIRDFYGARGYIDALVLAEKVPNVERGTIDLVYNITEEKKFRVARIDIKGNTKTKDRVIRRELAISPGETFDMVRVKISKQRLEQMNYFEKVDAKPEPTDRENERNLVIGVDEKSTGNIAVGAGFDSVQSLVGFIEVTQGNFDLFNPPTFTGGGQKARVRVQYGTLSQDYVIGFTEPWFLGQRLRLDTQIHYEEIDYYSSNYRQRMGGGSVGLSKQLPFNLVGGVTYSIDNIGISFNSAYKASYPATVTNIVYTTNYVGGKPVVTSTPTTAPGPQPVLLGEEGSRLQSKLGFSLAHDTRNSALLADRGHRIELFPEVTGGPLAGQVNNYRLELRASQFFAPSRLVSSTSPWQNYLEGHVLEIDGQIGVIDAFGDGDRGIPGRVPLFNRYYIGGLYTLRGYSFRKVGPTDELTSEPIGGKTMWFGSAEYSIPIIERLRIAFFYDVGMVYENAYSFAPVRYKDGSTTGIYSDDFGFGLRLNLPIGPLKLDYGIPITHDKYSGSSGKFQFGVGYQRQF
jgi:outer membrane protein insertion porin family